MAGAAAAIMSRYASSLADVADHVMGQVPETEDWDIIRHFLRNVTGLLRNGDIRAGFRAFMRIIPYVQRCLSSVEKVANVSNTYEITETVSRHFLVDEGARDQLEKVMTIVKEKVKLLREKVEDLAKKLDKLLEDVVLEGLDLSIMTSLKLAFQMNRIAALVHVCEDNLHRAREMLDTLDTHVAGKSFLASLFSAVAFFTGIAFSATGNLPIGGACLAAATAGRQSAQKLEDYRKELVKMDEEHHNLQIELTTWKHNFRAEQRNFVLLIGLKRVLVFLLLLAIGFFFLGKALNYIVFASLFMYLVVKSEEHNAFRYYAGIFLGVMAMIMEIEKHQGMAVFNTGGCAVFITAYLGYVDI